MGRGFGRNTQRPKQNSACRKEANVLNIDLSPNEFFTADASVDDHYKAQNQNRSKYIAGITLLQQKGVDLQQRVKVRALAASWARHDSIMSRTFLSHRDRFGFVEVLKALQLIDSGRQIRQTEKKLKRLQLSKNRVSSSKIGKLKTALNNMKNVKPKHGSASAWVRRQIRQWVRALSKEDLESYALHFPKKHWRKLADICHLHPSDDFKLSWFLPYCFGTPAPRGSLAHNCMDLNEKTLNEKLKTCDIPYAHIRQFKDALTVENKVRIASSEPQLDTILWHYQDVGCPEVDAVLLKRLESGDTVNLPLGSVMDRLLTLANIDMERSNRRKINGNYEIPFMKNLIKDAELKLQDIKLSLETPVVVIGDRSSSMSVAVRTSSIIAGILSSICSADLVFFNDRCQRPKKVPSNVEEVLDLALKTSAHGSTNPVLCLWPYYKRKRVVKTFVVVTDEGENGDYSGYTFGDLFEKYHNEVYPARLVFVSFLNQHEQGPMVKDLKSKGFQPLQFVRNEKQPDLTKLDKLFGILQSESRAFDKEMSALERKIEENIHAVDGQKMLT